MKVVDESEVEQISIDKPSKVWSIIKIKSGIDKCFFDAYYKDRDEAVAYKLTNVVRYKNPRELKDYGIKCAPQFYQYIEENILVLKYNYGFVIYVISKNIFSPKQRSPPNANYRQPNRL